MATIPYADVITTERIPIDAQDIVTRVRLVIAGNRAGREPDRDTVYDNTTDELVTYFPDPIVFVYEATEHAALGCERSFALPEGYNPFLSPDDALVPEPDLVSGFTNTGTPSAIRDGDPTTNATLTTGAGGLIRYQTDTSFVGFKLRCAGRRTVWSELFHVTVRAGRIPRWDEGNVTPFGAFYQFDVPSDEDSENDHEMYAVLPHEARNQPVNAGPTVLTPDMSLRLTVGSSTADVVVTAFYPLILNEALLEEVARANIRLPASDPSRVTVAGYVAPDRSHTITGWPGGDYTGQVAQHQYELGRTIIDFEQAGAPTGLPAEARETAMEREKSKADSIAASTYPLKMAPRQ